MDKIAMIIVIACSVIYGYRLGRQEKKKQFTYHWWIGKNPNQNGGSTYSSYDPVASEPSEGEE